MTRRTIGLLVIFVCLMAPLAVDAQPVGKVWRIGVLHTHRSQLKDHPK
jgi:hypothetical protein